ncbi:unnamed protein product [Blepharisma stoltei]|uniref:DUF3835 domain-containing protein n=1 Tax=Blepharisma stoltei TaxID=1481888 RepID=A0AAU9IU56_9CILI|nr:unnamed protein product [Blepharisma stoltei]
MSISQQTPGKNSTPAFEQSQFSPYDTIENLNFQANSLFTSLDKLSLPSPEQQKLIDEIKTGILNLLSEWEDAYEAKIQVPAISIPPNSLKNTEDSEEELRKIREEYEIRIIELEEKLKETENTYLKMHADCQDQLKDIDHDIDEIMHHYKQKWKKKPVIGNILQDLFSQEELEEEGRIALGEKRKTKEIQIKKLEVSGEENWDMNADSEESSGPPSQLEGSGLILYDKLHNLKKKLYNYRHREENSLKNTLDNAFVESLPISMRSISNCESLKLTNLLSGLKSRDSSLLAEQIYGKGGKIENKINEIPKIDQNFKPNELNNLLSEKLTLDEKEQLVLTLIDRENSEESHDVCLEDLLDISQNDVSRKEITVIEATEQSENSFASFLKANSKNPENNSLNFSDVLTFKKPEKDSFISQEENSFDEFLKEKSFSRINDSKSIEISCIVDSKPFENSNIEESKNLQSFSLLLSPINSSKPPFFPAIIPSRLDASNDSMQNNSLFSDNSIPSPNNPKKKTQKRQLLNRPKIFDKEDSSILPPLNTSAESKSKPKIQLLPQPPSEPSQRKKPFSFRGRFFRLIAASQPKLIPNLPNPQFL